MDVKPLIAIIASCIGSLLTGFGIADTAQAADLTNAIIAVGAGIITIVSFVSTVILHRKAVANAAVNAAVTGSTEPNTATTPATEAHNA